MPSPADLQQTLEKALNLRALSMITDGPARHLRQPGNLDSPAPCWPGTCCSPGCRRWSPSSAGAPNSAVVVDATARVEFLRTVQVDAEGRGSIDGAPSLGPAPWPFSLNWETYVRLACGRVPSRREIADRIKVRGDQELATAILANFAVTP
ncbi:maleylpyruvate isomerase family mycothiol-dependent enzyme [Streptomyces californicus]